MTPRFSRAGLLRETAKSAAGGLLGAVVPGLAGLGGAEAAVVHGMRDVAVGLMPMIFTNALMSALIPAVFTLWRMDRRRLLAERGLALLIYPAAVVLGLAVAGTISAMGLIHLATLAFSLTGLAAAGTMVVRATQAVLVALVLTPLTIVLLSPGVEHG